MTTNPVDALLRDVVQALWDTPRAQVVIADDLHISTKHLSMIRQGRAEPSLTLLRDMCRVLGVRAGDAAPPGPEIAPGIYRLNTPRSPMTGRLLTAAERQRCWAMADDNNPDCPIGSARCVQPTEHDGPHVWEATR